MPRGPAPDASSRRRNAPTISTTLLPAGGRTGRPPAVPKRFALGPAGKAWWSWAWKLPQATQWDKASIYFVARRAELEDMAAALQLVDDVDLVELLELDEEDDDGKEQRRLIRNIEAALRTLKSAAGGAVGLMREMRELDNRLGLNPKAMIDLRWTVEKPVPADAPAPDVTSLDEYRDRLG